MIEIMLPIGEKEVRALHTGDFVSISGRMYTGRDVGHAWLAHQLRPEFRDLLRDRMIYHCGPVVKKTEKGWVVLSAGPTTSERDEPYQATIIQEYSVRGVIGKGGMGPKTLAACKEFGAVYLHAIGGAGALTAQRIKKVTNVYMLEFGTPEAFWEIEVEGFPAIVTMDSHGHSLHEDVLKRSEKEYMRLMAGK